MAVGSGSSPVAEYASVARAAHADCEGLDECDDFDGCVAAVYPRDAAPRSQQRQDAGPLHLRMRAVNGAARRTVHRAPALRVDQGVVVNVRTR